MLQSWSLYRDSHPLQTVNSTSQFIIISKLAKDTFDSHIQITDNGEQKWPHCWVLGNTHSDYPPVKSIITIKNWDKKSPFLIPICFVTIFIKYQSSIFFRPIVEILKPFFFLSDTILTSVNSNWLFFFSPYKCELQFYSLPVNPDLVSRNLFFPPSSSKSRSLFNQVGLLPHLHSTIASHCAFKRCILKSVQFSWISKPSKADSHRTLLSSSLSSSKFSLKVQSGNSTDLFSVAPKIFSSTISRQGKNQLL